MKKVLKIFGITISIIIAILVILLIIFVAKQFKQESLLNKEMVTIFDMDWNTEEVDMTIKTNGEIGRLEKIMKNYYQEFYKYRREYDEVDIYDFCKNSLEAQNLKDADLVKTKEQLIEYYNKSEKALEKIIEMIDNDYRMKLVENKKFDEYDIELYIEYMFLTDEKETMEEWVTQGNYEYYIYELTIEALNVLINNPNDWKIQDNRIYFSNDSVLKQFNDIINLLNNYEKEDNSGGEA